MCQYGMIYCSGGRICLFVGLISAFVFLSLLFVFHHSTTKHEHKLYGCNQSHPKSHLHLHLHVLFMVQELELWCWCCRISFFTSFFVHYISFGSHYILLVFYFIYALHYVYTIVYFISWLHFFFFYYWLVQFSLLLFLLIYFVLNSKTRTEKKENLNWKFLSFASSRFLLIGILNAYRRAYKYTPYITISVTPIKHKFWRGKKNDSFIFFFRLMMVLNIKSYIYLRFLFRSFSHSFRLFILRQGIPKGRNLLQKE